MRALLAVGLVGLAGYGAADDAADPTAGKWVVESVVRDGKEDPELKGAVREHKGGEYTITPAEGKKAQAVKGKVATDAKKSPATIDMTPSAGRYKDQVLKGIYKVDGDTLTVAFAEPGKDRPAAFESKPGGGVVLAVHKRAK